jgi:ATP-dependent DNA helicase PIF1
MEHQKNTDQIEFSEEQKSVYDSFIQGKNIFMTGPGGSGKTYLIRELYKWCIENNKSVQVCALTGCAAVLLQAKAKTVHSWAGIGLANGDALNIISRVVNNKHKKKNWLYTDVLIIDEVSMMSSKLLDILDAIGRKVRRVNKPFGGIQLLFSGDFYQLPPVGNRDDDETMKYCFESSIWEDIFDIEIHLIQIFRQTDETYANILNQIREGKLFKKSFLRLKERCVECEDSIIKPTKLMPRKLEVNTINLQELEKLEGEERTFDIKVAPSSLFNLSEKDKRILASTSADQIKFEIENLKSNIMADDKIILKVGAQVMCIVNMDQEITNNSIVNGSCGIIVEFHKDDGYPVILFRNGTTRKIGPHIWESEHIKGIGIMQLPLILAWAITIHKAQGATLEQAEVDIGGGIFECGQTYVALSRVKDIDGLFLTGFDPNRIKVSKKVQKYYERFK